MIRGLLYLFIMLFTLASCTKQPKSDTARISDPEDLLTTNEGTIYEIDTATSIITWVGTKPTGRHNGIFKILNGKIQVVKIENQIDSQLVNDQVEKHLNKINHASVTININSIDILDLKDDRVQYNILLKYLRSDDFLQVDKFPEAKFELISIKEMEEDTTKRINNEFTVINPTHKVKGNLTLKGITKSIEFPIRMDMRNQKLEASAKFNIDRTAWSIHHQNENDPVARTKDGLINNVVNVGFEIIAYSQDP